MQYLIISLSLLVLFVTACTPGRTTLAPTLEIQTPVPATVIDIPANGQLLEGPDINFNGIRFTLDPAIGSRLYVFEDATSIDGMTAHNFRFALTSEEYCQTWCLMVYRVVDFEQAFGSFVFPPAGYRGGAAVIFRAQEMELSFQNGSGDRGLETFGQDHYGVSNESLKYVFRGYRADKQYGVYLQIPTRAMNLPDVAPTMATDVQNILDYNQNVIQSVNTLTPADFTPDLNLLDTLVTSISVETP
jgi:hypothetical protein